MPILPNKCPEHYIFPDFRHGKILTSLHIKNITLMEFIANMFVALHVVSVVVFGYAARKVYSGLIWDL